MPIDYKEYHPKWKLISRLVRFRRAKNRCEWCGLQNGIYIHRNEDGTHARVCASVWEAVRAKKWSGWSEQAAFRLFGYSRVVLTVAHLDHDKTNNRFWNLAALCQKCHLGHDAKQHAENRKYGRNWKKNQLKLEL